MKKIFTILLVVCASISLWASNTITYTASAKLSETTSSSGLKTNAFDVSITSHTFSNGIGIITFADDVTSIGDRAFYYCSRLMSVTIPESVTSIGDEAFYGCTGLTFITIPEGVTDVGTLAFYKCSSLTSVTLPNSVISIEGSTFLGCSGLTTIVVESDNPIYDSRDNCNAIIETATNTLIVGCQNTTIPNSVTSIGNSAFSYCSGLTSINIPSSMTSIGSFAFEGCSGLTSVYVSDLIAWCGITFNSKSSNPLTYAKHLFLNGTEITSLVIPNNVTTIGNYAFKGCLGFTSVTLPSSISSIGKHAFEDCSGLTTIVVESGNPIYDSRNNCNAIIETATNTLIVGCQNTTIPNSVTSIGDEAFYGCIGLTSINIPNSVTSIGNSAFEGCSGLTSITIGEGVTTIGNCAFYNCTNLKKLFNSSSLPITNGSSDYGYVAYYASKVYKGIIVGDFVIFNDTILTGYIGSGGDVEIPNRVTSIGDHAFENCYGLTSVTIPNSITNIGTGAFYGCLELTSVHITDIAAWCDIAFSSPEANPLCNAHHLFLNGEEITNLEIPNSVTSIGNRTFYGCSGLTSITIPKSVTTIGREAFCGCSGLTSVMIPDSVTSIGNFAFSSCSRLTSVTWNAINCALPSYYNTAPFYDIRSNITSFTFGEEVESIPPYLCYSMSNLTSLTIPNSVTSIGDETFCGCTGLTSITISKGVTSIGSYAFSSCSGLTSVVWNAASFPSPGSSGYTPFYNCRTQITNFTIGESVTNLPDYLCYGMTQLSSITLPASVTKIGSSTFNGCTGLRKVTMGEVAQIGNNAFNDCTGIISMTIGATTPPLAQSNSFTGVSSTCILNVPCSAEQLYRAAQYWNTFTNYSEGFAYSLNVTSADALQGHAAVVVEPSCTNSSATILATPTPGYIFSQWSDGNTDNPRTLYVTDNMSIEAQFETYVPAQLNVLATNTNEGAAYGAGAYNSGDEALIFAIPADGYKFTGWNDGVTANPRTVVVAGDSTFTAAFAPVLAEATYEVNVSSVNLTWGSASAQEAVVLTAVPEAGYNFLMWSDGNTENPRAIILTDDINLTAIFTSAAASEASATMAPENDLRKELIQGQVYITRDGSTYTVLGTKIK